MPLDILVFAAHPDDAELGCGGTIAALTQQGKRVGIVDLTHGEMGTRGTIETRKQEAQQASNVLGVCYRHTLDLGDSILENSRNNQLQIIEIVREQQPAICIIGAPFDRHPDHGKATQLCIDALFYSGLKNIQTRDASGQEQTPWRPSHILHYLQDRPAFQPDFIFDITEFWETKKKAILAYSTQFNVQNTDDEPATYISSENYFKQLEGRARYFGHLGGFEFGEPFKYYNGPVPLSDFESFLKQKPIR